MGFDGCQKWEKTVSIPNNVIIDGIEFVRKDRRANRVSCHLMYDCHLFRRLKGTTIDELLADWGREVKRPKPDLGAPMLCPIIVMEDDKELRRVGQMVFPDTQWSKSKLDEWLGPVRADPDIARILASQSAKACDP